MERQKIIGSEVGQFAADERVLYAVSMVKDLNDALDGMLVNNTLDEIAVVGLGLLSPMGHARFGDAPYVKVDFNRTFHVNGDNNFTLRTFVLQLIHNALGVVNASVLAAEIKLIYHRRMNQVTALVTLAVPSDVPELS